jgi:hypothetical protein
MTDTAIRQRSVKITGARALMLIQALAVGDRKYADLADDFAVEEKTITNFADRNRMAIREAARDQASKVAGLWIVRKELRIATYQAEAERNLELIEDMQEAVRAFSESAEIPMSPDTDKLARLQSNIFRAMQAVAEECGDLPSRQAEPPKQSGVRYIIEGLENWDAA